MVRVCRLPNLFWAIFRKLRKKATGYGTYHLSKRPQIEIWKRQLSMDHRIWSGSIFHLCIPYSCWILIGWWRLGGIWSHKWCWCTTYATNQSFKRPLLAYWYRISRCVSCKWVLLKQYHGLLHNICWDCKFHLSGSWSLNDWCSLK